MLIAERLKEEQIFLGKRVLELKKRGNISQKELAEISGLNIRVIRRIEKGEANPELKTILKLSLALKTNLAKLFDSKGQLRITSASSTTDFDNKLVSEKRKIGKRISQLCLHRGIDQEELGVLSNIASSDISLYINGEENVVLLTLLKIAVGLEVELFDLFNYKGMLPDNKKFKGKVQF